MNALISSLVILATATAAGGPQTYEFTGVARTDDGAVFYVERHQVLANGGVPIRVLTTYTDVDGRLLAKLKTDFSKDRFAPDYEMTDARGRKLRSVQTNGDRLHVEAGGDAVQIKAPPTNVRRLVTGQGLDQYARYHRAVLANGQSLAVRFPIPTRQDVYGFRLSPIETSRDDIVRVEIKIDNWVVALVAPSIFADYDLETGRLLRYYGVSNLTDARGENPKVEILYDYHGRGS